MRSFLAALPGLLRVAFSTVLSALSEEPWPVVRVQKQSSRDMVVVKTCARLVSITTRIPASNNQNIETRSPVSHPWHPNAQGDYFAYKSGTVGFSTVRETRRHVTC